MVNRKVLAFVLGLSLVLMPQAVVAQNVEQLLDRGAEAGNAGRYSEAERIFRQILEIEPNNAIAHYNLGVALRNQGKLAEAISAYQRAIAIDPNNAVAYNNLGSVLSDQGKLVEAISTYRRAIEIDPNYANAYYNLGLVLYDQGKLAEAISTYRRVIEIDPNYANAYNDLGNALYGQGKLAEAISAFQHAIQLDPNNARAYYNLGVALLYDQGKLAEAISTFQLALSFPSPTGSPTNTHSMAHNGLGYALQQQGDFEAAIFEYQEAIQLDPNWPPPQNNLKEVERLLALRLNPPPPNIEEILPNPEERPFFPLQRSVVLVLAQTTRGSNRGSGWVIKREDNKAWIVTNRHVISENEGNKRSSDNIEIELYSLLPPEQRLRLPARIAHITSPTDSLDLAVLEVTNLPEDIQPLTLSPSPVALDADVRIIGHPITGNSWSMLRGYIAANTPSEEGKDIQIAGADLAFGNSGSPVLYNNRVVALVVEIGDEASAATEENNRVIGGFGFAYPIQTVLQQLREWGVYP